MQNRIHSTQHRNRLRPRARGFALISTTCVAMPSLLTACVQNAATATPGPTQTATNPPPTATPTRTPTPLPPIPTANFTPDQIVGIWFRSEVDRGALYLTISGDGIYDAAHGTVEGSVHHGHYSLDALSLLFSMAGTVLPNPPRRDNTS